MPLATGSGDCSHRRWTVTPAEWDSLHSVSHLFRYSIGSVVAEEQDCDDRPIRLTRQLLEAIATVYRTERVALNYSRFRTAGLPGFVYLADREAVTVSLESAGEVALQPR